VKVRTDCLSAARSALTEQGRNSPGEGTVRKHLENPWRRLQGLQPHSRLTRAFAHRDPGA
jgi:hypothetical protein